MTLHRQLIGSRRIAALPRCRTDCLRALLATDTWATAAESVWGHCGVTASIEEQTVGYLLFAPAEHIRAMPGNKTASRKTIYGAFIVALWQDPTAPHPDIRGALLSHVAAELRTTGGKALTLRATRLRPTCLQPAARDMHRYGFRTVAEPPIFPVMRMDLNMTILASDTEKRARRKRVFPPVRRPGLPPAPAQRRP